MRISTIKYFGADAVRSLKRNRTISLASSATVAATLFIFGVFLLAILNVNQGIKDVESKVEVKIFLKNDITVQQQNEIQSKINATSGVKTVVFESKNEALNKLKEQLGDENKSLADGMDKNNPMPNSYIVRVEKPEDVSSVVSNVKNLQGIDEIKDGRNVVNKLITITKAIKWVGIVIFLVLIGVSLFLIGNTIKLTVYSRRREIGIMKLVGATDWFIRWPFIIEGVIMGIIGAIISSVILFYAYKVVFLKASSAFIIVQLVSPSYILQSILWWFILAGTIIGGAGSIISIRKFLRV